MKLVGSFVFILIGIVAGVLISLVFREKHPGVLPNAVIGVLGAFFGLFIKDVFDVDVGGNLGGAMLFSALGALVLLLPVNLAYRRLFIG